MPRYVIDPMHSDIEFKIKHLMISTVKGKFNSYDAWMESESNDFSKAKIECIIDTGSIYTSIKDRDDHLRSSDFFNVDNYGQTKFGLYLEGKIKRSDWQLDFNVAGGKNTLLIGDEVKLDIGIQMI